MKIRIIGKFEKTAEEVNRVSWIGDNFVFVWYLPGDILLGDVFILEDGTEIILKEIKLQFDTKEPLTMMSHGWKCFCRFEGLDLNKVPVAQDWYDNTPSIIAIRKEKR